MSTLPGATDVEPTWQAENKAPTRSVTPDPPLRILFVKDGLGIGGTETQLLALAAGLRSRGHDVLVANLSAAAALEPRFVDVGVNVYQIPRRGRLDPRPIVQLARLIATTRPDVVNSFHWLPNLFAAAARRLALSRAPLIGAIRSHYYRGQFGRLRAILDRFSSPLLDAVIANDDSLLAHAREHRIVHKRPYVIRNGVAIPPVPVPRHQAGELRFTAVGRLTPVKRCQDILRAADAVGHALPQARFWFVGEGPERESLERLTRELGLTKTVRFFGAVQDPGTILSESDVLILASEHEGSPNAILEGMSWGLPVIGTRTGGIPNLVREGETGLLVAVGDVEELSKAISTLAQSDGLRIKFGRRARDVVSEEFSVDRMVAQYLSVYRSVLRDRAAC